MLISHRTARLLGACALVLATPTLASCSTDMPTDKVYTPAAGVNNRDGAVDVLNAVIVSTEDGKGTFIATLVNNKVNEVGGGDNADEFLRLDGEVTAKAFEPIEIAAAGMTVLSAESETQGIPVTGDFKAGDFVDVTLTFKNAESATLTIPVVANAGDFEGQDGEPVAEETDDHAHEDGESEDHGHDEESTEEESAH